MNMTSQRNHRLLPRGSPLSIPHVIASVMAAAGGTEWVLRGPGVPLAASPSMMWNNLSGNGVRLAYAHKDEVHTVAEAASEGAVRRGRGRGGGGPLPTHS